jgi:CRISPR-associated endonuclease/helicase Cas3
MGKPDVAAAVAAFRELTGRRPCQWQERLLRDWFLGDRVPQTVDIPTELGKTTTVTLWLVALAMGANLPRGLIYVVDRRTVVDQATVEAEKLRDGLERVPENNTALGLENRRLPISTLRGQFVDNRESLGGQDASASVVETPSAI